MIKRVYFIAAKIEREGRADYAWRVFDRFSLMRRPYPEILRDAVEHIASTHNAHPEQVIVTAFNKL